MFHFIDDDPMLRDLLDAFISDAGYESMGFESAVTYIDFLNSPNFVNPIAVISDIRMPGINGYELTLKIHEKHPSQKIILMTGNADYEQHGGAKNQLCYTLDKPFRAKDLIALLKAMEACENTHKAADTNEYFKQCKFGIDHDCPLYKLKHLS